jgi:nucleotide-binding universal stress UspA family protein
MLLTESAIAGLLVVGAGERDHADEHDAGPVCRHIAAAARCPVLVVRGDIRPGAVLVVGVDGRQPSSAAVEFAFEEAAQRGVALHAMNAWTDQDQATGDQLLRSALQGWPDKYPTVALRREMVHGVQPAQALLAESRWAGLIVIGPHAAQGLRSLLPGGVAQTLLRHAGCPVAVVHPFDTTGR